MELIIMNSGKIVLGILVGISISAVASNLRVSAKVGKHFLQRKKKNK